MYCASLDRFGGKPSPATVDFVGEQGHREIDAEQYFDITREYRGPQFAKSSLRLASFGCGTIRIRKGKYQGMVLQHDNKDG